MASLLPRPAAQSAMAAGAVRASGKPAVACRSGRDRPEPSYRPGHGPALFLVGHRPHFVATAFDQHAGQRPGRGAGRRHAQGIIGDVVVVAANGGDESPLFAPQFVGRDQGLGQRRSIGTISLGGRAAGRAASTAVRGRRRACWMGSV